MPENELAATTPERVARSALRVLIRPESESTIPERAFCARVSVK